MKVHLLHASYEELLRDALLEVVEPKALKTSRGIPLDAKELKNLVLETEQEKIDRREKEREASSRKSNSKKDSKYVRRAQLLPVENTLISKELQNDIGRVLEKYNISDK